MRTTWTQDMRRTLYTRLRNEIGPHNTWDKKIRPKAKRAQYDRLLEELAIRFSAKTTAIQNQINWATTTQRRTKDESHSRNLFLNKSAALEVGFISASMMPSALEISKSERPSKPFINYE